jgi:hypothetical protein
MTYRELATSILIMNDEQKDSIVTIFDTNISEFFPVASLSFSEDDDVLDKGHPFLIVNTQLKGS